METVKQAYYDSAIQIAKEAVSNAKQHLKHTEKYLEKAIQHKKDACSHENTSTSEGAPGGMGIYYQHKWCTVCNYRWPSFSEWVSRGIGYANRESKGTMLFKPGTANTNISSGN